MSGRRLALQLVAASSLGVLGVVVLQHYVQAHERQAGAGSALRLPVVASALPALGFRLTPTTGAVHLVSRLDAVPPAVQPVLQLLADGSLAVRRPPPVAATPLRRPGAEMAIVVPRQPLAAWSPAARGTLAELLATLVVARPLPREQLRLVDVGFGEAELRMLLDWLP